MSEKTAVIDERGIYRGMRKASDDLPVGWQRLPGITSCDLEQGKYKWVDGAFLPLGGGFGKPKAGRVPQDYAIYCGFKAIAEGKPLPPVTLEWLEWYGANIAPRHAERLG